MAVQDLIQKVKCLKFTSDSNFSLKESLLAIGSAIKTGFIKLGTAIGQSVINSATKEIKDAGKILDNTLAEANAAYDSAASALKNIQNPLDGIFSQTCDSATSNLPATPKVNPVAELASLPSTNDDKVNGVK